MYRTRWTFSSLLLLAMSHTASAKWQDSITLTTHNLCPYGCYELKPSDINSRFKSSNKDKKRLTFKGVAVSVVQCALQALDQPYDIVVVPWARAQKMVQTNQADGFFSASKQDSRDEYAVFSEIIAEQKWQWYLLKDNPLNPEQVGFKNNALVGGFIGANMLSWLEKNEFKVAAKATNSEVLLQLLLRRRVDAILANNHVMDELIRKSQAEDKIKYFVNKDKPLAVYFAKTFIDKHKDFLPAFNDKVRSCRTPHKVE